MQFHLFFTIKIFSYNPVIHVCLCKVYYTSEETQILHHSLQ